LPLLAVSDEVNHSISIYDGRGENVTPIHVIKGLHRSVISLMSYNDTYDCVISADEGGMLEYWRPSGSYEKPDNVFEYKSSTNLFEFKKVRAIPRMLGYYPNSTFFLLLLM
jgi:peptidylprolyl isomerase domain and WD repeat-containing protein 1